MHASPSLPIPVTVTPTVVPPTPQLQQPPAAPTITPRPVLAEGKQSGTRQTAGQQDKSFAATAQTALRRGPRGSNLDVLV